MKKGAADSMKLDLQRQLKELIFMVCNVYCGKVIVK